MRCEWRERDGEIIVNEETGIVLGRQKKGIRRGGTGTQNEG